MTDNLKIKRLILGPIMTNCYVFCDTSRGRAAVIDPADSPDIIEKAVKDEGCEVELIILTHGHYDHVGGLKGLQKLAPEAVVYSHQKGTEVLGDPDKSCCTDIGGKPQTFAPDKTVADGDIIRFGEYEFKVIYTPGHTIDSICLMFEGMIFCGDTVFRNSIGRADLPTGNPLQEIESIKTKLMILDDNIPLYPGHGESTTIGYERKNNIYIR